MEIKPNALPIMPDCLLPHNFNRNEINAENTMSQKVKNKSKKARKKRKAGKKAKRKNR